MKKILFLLPVLLLAYVKTFAESDTSAISVNVKVRKEYTQVHARGYCHNYYDKYKPIDADSIKERRFDVEVLLRNKTAEPIYFWTMSCSWYENFLVNNNYVEIDGWPCDRNFAIAKSIRPYDSLKLNFTLVMSINVDHPDKEWPEIPQVKTTKIGLILVNELFHDWAYTFEAYIERMNDKSAQRIVWSNPLYLLK